MGRAWEIEGRGVSCRCPLVVDRSRMGVDGHQRHQEKQLSTARHGGWKSKDATSRGVKLRILG